MRTIAIFMLAILSMLPASLLAQSGHSFGVSLVGQHYSLSDTNLDAAVRTVYDPDDLTKAGLGLSYRYQNGSWAFQTGLDYIDDIGITLDVLGLYVQDVGGGGGSWFVGGGASALNADIDGDTLFFRDLGSRGSPTYNIDEKYIGWKLVSGYQWEVGSDQQVLLSLEYADYGDESFDDSAIGGITTFGIDGYALRVGYMF